MMISPSRWVAGALALSLAGTWRWSCRNCVAPSCVALLLACAAGATEAQASTFPDTLTFSTVATAGDNNKVGGPTAEANSVSQSLSIPSHIQTSGGMASVVGTPSPNLLIRGRVEASSHVETDAAPGNERAGLAPPVAYGEARLLYDVFLGDEQQLPLAWRFSPFSVPIAADAVGFTTAFDGVAGVELRVEYVSRFTGSANVFFDGGGFSTTGTVIPQVFHVEAFLTPQFTFLGVEMGVSAEATLDLAPNGGPWRSFARATLDPSFSFDQAAFDAEAAQLGLPTFPLDQYYSFQFSPGLAELGAQPVSEPPSFALVVTGLILLIAAAGFGRRSRTPAP